MRHWLWCLIWLMRWFRRILGLTAKKTGRAVVSVWANLAFCLRRRRTGEGKVLLSALLPPAGCAGLKAHQMLQKPLASAFFGYSREFSVALKWLIGKIWWAVELAWSTCMWWAWTVFIRLPVSCGVLYKGIAFLRAVMLYEIKMGMKGGSKTV